MFKYSPVLVKITTIGAKYNPGHEISRFIKPIKEPQFVRNFL